MSKSLAILLVAVMVAAPQVNGFNFTTANIADIQSAIKQGYMTCHDIVQGYLDRIEKYGKSSATTTGAIINTNPAALKEADALDDYFKTYKKLKGPLHCAPLHIKDCVDVAGVATTNGLTAFNNQIPLKDATVVKNCKDQGAIFIAKANMSPLSDKEAWGHSETGGLIRNPFALDYTTYGSSGGNSAAANSMLGIGGIAGETGVSINLPSSTGNLVGFRPPVQILEDCKCREGVLPNNFYEDVVGPIARSIDDALLIFDGMIAKPGEYSGSVKNPRGLSGMKVNIFDMLAYGTFPFPPAPDYKVDPQIQSLFTIAANNMAGAGATVKNASVTFDQAAQYIFAMFGADTSSCIPGWREGYFGDATRFGPGPAYHSTAEVIAAKKLPAYYQNIWEDIANKSQEVGKCEAEKTAFETARNNLRNNAIPLILGGADIAIWPTVPEFPAKLGKDAFDKDWGSATQAPINLVLLASWAAYPSITIPLGFSDPTPDTPQGLPVGLHMMTTPDKFPMLLKAAYAYQANFAVSRYPTNFVDPMTTTTPTPTTTTKKAAATTVKPGVLLSFALLILALLFAR